MRRKPSGIALASLALIACAANDDGEQTENSATPDAGVHTAAPVGCAALELTPPGADEGVQLALELTLEPGQERQVCKLVMVDHAVNLNWAEGVYSRGSHHGLVARSSYRDTFPEHNIRGEVVDGTQVADCESVNADWDVLSVIATAHAAGENPNAGLNRKGSMPDDVALKIADKEVLVMNFHMLNPTDHALTACYKQNLYGIPDAQVKREAGTMFYYNSYVTLPAHQHASATMACPVSEDVTLGAQVSHMHRRGVSYHAALLETDPLVARKEVRSLYETNTWQEPVVQIDTPPLALTRGQWIEWRCDYDNTTDLNIAQGQQTSDEMCMFNATYWPRSPEMDYCMAPGSKQWYSAARPLATGRLNGAQYLECWNDSPKAVYGGGSESSAARYASQRCITESCTNVSGRVNEFAAGGVDPTTITCD